MSSRTKAIFLPAACVLLAPATLSASVDFSKINGATRSEPATAKAASETISADEAAKLLDALASPETRDAARERLVANPPRAALVAALKDASLERRVAALEILEETGGASDFDPWLPPGDPANAGPLALWDNRASSPAAASGDKGATIDDDRRLSYLRDILGENPDKARRAGAMFARDGARSIPFLEKFLKETPALTPGLRARVRSTEYRIALSRAFAERSGAVADSLVSGTRDRILAAIETLRTAGAEAVPVLRDFLTHDDELVREAAFDVILVCGRAKVFPVVAEALKGERDPNVIHGALRSMKDIRTPEAAAVVAGYIASDDEELALSAIRTAIAQTGEYRSGRSPAADKAVVAALASPSWRVRAEALEYVALRTPEDAKPGVMKALDDKDDFVRAAAMKAAMTMRIAEALPKLREQFMRDASYAGPVFAAFVQGSGSGDDDAPSSGKGVDDAMLKRLLAASPEAKLSVVQAASGEPGLIPVLRRLATDADEDVACSALRTLAGDEERVLVPETAALLAAALRDGDDAKRLAVVRGLRLKRVEGDAAEAVSDESDEAAGPAKPTTLDGLFDAFDKSAASPPAAKPPEKKGATDDLFADFGATAPEKSAVPTGNPRALITGRLAELTASDTVPAATRITAATALACAGEPAGIAWLTARYGTLDTAMRSTLADRLPPAGAAAPLFALLLADPVAEVCSEAAGTAIGSESPKVRAAVYAELDRPGTALRPSRIYGWNFENRVREPGVPDTLRKWAAKKLSDADAAPEAVVLASLALRKRVSDAEAGVLERLARNSENVSVRRACWLALLSAKPRDIGKYAESVAADASPFVREALPAACIGANSGFKIRFDDAHEADDARWDSEAVAPRITDETERTLRRLAGSDPSADVRFRASFALMAQRRAFDAEAFRKLIAGDTEKRGRAMAVASWMRSNLSRLTPAMRPVLDVVTLDRLDDDDMATLRRRVGTTVVADVPASFELMGRSEPAKTAETKPGAETANVAVTDDTPVPSKNFVAVFFRKPGCPECAKTAGWLALVKKDFPGMTVEEHNILEPDGILLNQLVCSRLEIPSQKHGLAPSVFTRAGVLTGNDLSPKSLAELFSRTREKSGDDAWRVPDKAGRVEAAKAVDTRYDALTLWVVLLAGLVDGINPCAFATIIFFLSYLRITRRTSREMLLTGSAFIAGVFVAYFSAGLVLYRVLDVLNGFAWLQRGMNLAFGGLALVAAGLSLADAVRAKKGRLDEMTLKLPKFLGDRIRTTIREGAKARAFVTAAFVTGIVVSFIELACTGQVYAPIVYKIRQGSAGAVGMLLIYNLAFILPLVALFVATWAGMKNDRLLDFQKRHTFAVKLALAALFLALAGMIFLG